MKRALILAFSHLVLIGGGYLLHRSIAPPARAAAAPAKSPESKPTPVSSSAADGKPSYSGGEYRKAWRASAGAKLSPQELAQVREKLWNEWLEKDPRSALITLAEEGTISTHTNRRIFGEWFKGREEEMLDWILAGDFGIDGSALLQLWSERVGDNPDLLLSFLPKLPADSRNSSIKKLFGGPVDRTALDNRLARISAMPGERDRELAWNTLLEGVIKSNPINHYEDLFPELMARPDLPPAVREAALGTFSSRLFQNRDSAKALEDFRKLAPEGQSFLVPKLLAASKESAWSYQSGVTNALTMLAEHGDWEIIAKDGADAIEYLYKNGQPNADSVSRWALELPARDETVTTYRRAVAGRFREDLAGGSDWAASLPEGWYRDQAYAQLAMTADAHHKDPAARDQAISAITDPTIRQELEQWRNREAKAR
ncbi:hypothetical protein [Haloferula sp. BvORR071]|uniref:hypothetical protein n=1 Tax=Haloferula sp. BvORR071 TaxID=1396141 RepID=UPI00054D7B1D|nr:hypothetical protein [Haloferula sp. BvORR071]